MNVKLYKIFFLIGALLIPSCDEASNTISNPTEPNPIYEFNLAFSEDTDNSDTITLSWAKNSDIAVFYLKIDGNSTTVIDSTYRFPLSPGSFKKVVIKADNISSDSINVFSSPMAPSTWKPDLVDDIIVDTEFDTLDGTVYNQFEWIPSIETDITTVELYKCSYETVFMECPMPSSPLDPNFTILETFDSESYIFSEEKNDYIEKDCYVTKTIDQTNNSRYSQIICNDYNNGIDMGDIEITSVSNYLKNKIIIEWDAYSESDFYQYTLYRSANEDVDIDSRMTLAEITDVSQTIFEDRNDIRFGITWYYQIEVYNQHSNGKTSKSNIESGKSKP